MFNQVRVFNQKGKLLRIITSEALSKRHWGIFEKEMKPSFASTNSFTASKNLSKLKNKIGTYMDRYGLEGY
jgi:hypothetical protein